MSRTKTFDPQTVLDKAVNLLWFQGYERTTIQDLVDHLGIGRGSLYATFGGKRELFLAALDRYREQRNQRFIGILSQPPTAKAGIRAVFADAIEEALNDPQQRGCLMTNSTAEVAPHDPAVQERVAENRAVMVTAFRDTIRRGQESGEINPALDADALGLYFYNALQGIRVVAKTNPSRDMLTQIVSVTLTALDR
ncbi:MAG: TetR/AcrR family transcriptional regulator [Chloroflexi bacterium]|nr:TetR/AcrR family transcriptional regulator [Chloroflexota bacterium]